MQQAASELDEDRRKRIMVIEARDKIEQAADDAARSRSAKFGGKGDFMNRVNRQAGAFDLGERMRRGRGELDRELGAD